MAEGRRLVLIRHGRTAWNLETRAQGHADIELDEVGHAQAAQAATAVARFNPVALWTSDLARARQTAAYVEATTGLEARPDPRLREFSVGERTGLTMAEFAERFPREHADWRAGRFTRIPGAETGEDVLARLEPAYADILGDLGPGETALVVTHGACLKVATMALLRWPQAHAEALRGIDNGAWVVLEELEYRDRLRLVSYNETAHPGVHTPDFASDAPSR